jgi:hypothetical protein
LFYFFGSESFCERNILFGEKKEMAEANKIVRDLLNSTSVQLNELSVFITTWNMGNAEGKGWEKIFEPAHGFDIIVIGLQESTYTMKNGEDCKKHLQKQLTKALGDDYFEV